MCNEILYRFYFNCPCSSSRILICNCIVIIPYFNYSEIVVILVC
nr:MAG TPA: Pre-mRNA-splicing factor 8, Pre-mRNA-splicing splicing, Spliceosome, Catalytic Step [Caudoviricetes sp.]